MRQLNQHSWDKERNHLGHSVGISRRHLVAVLGVILLLAIGCADQVEPADPEPANTALPSPTVALEQEPPSSPDLPTATVEPTATASQPTVTLIPEATPTASPTIVPTSTPSPSPTATVAAATSTPPAATTPQPSTQVPTSTLAPSPTPVATATSTQTPVPPQPTEPPSPTPQPTVDAELASIGESLYQGSCTGCHSRGANTVVGPGHKDVFETAKTRVDGKSAVEYLQESIENPTAFIVPGFGGIMPSFAHFSESQILAIIEYLKTL